MRKSLAGFTSKLQEGKNLQLKGGFEVLANLRGGFILPTNSSTCDNSTTCSGTNSSYCNNTGDCSKSTNSSTHCTNSGGPGCCPGT